MKGFTLGSQGRNRKTQTKSFKLAQVLRVEITCPSATSKRIEVVSQKEKNIIQSPHLFKLTKCSKKQDQEKKKKR